MYLFLATVPQIGHHQGDTLKDYWLTPEQFYMAFYGETMKQDKFYHILRFLHFSENNNEPDKTNKNYNQLWKMRAIFDKLSYSFTKYYSPIQHLVADDNSVLFRGRIIFKQKNTTSSLG
jgi:hypothetical protein